MIKGKATIQLIDEKTGGIIRELHEENMITNAIDTILNPPDYIQAGFDSENDRSYNPLRDFAGNITDTGFHGVIICRDKIPEDANNMMLPWTNEEIGHAGISNANTDTTMGIYNENESGVIEDGKGYRHVWDFVSDRANGEINCICLTTKDGGTCGMHDAYWELSAGGIDLGSCSTGSFKSTYHTLMGRYINDSKFNCGKYKWFYMDRLENGNLRLLGKNTVDCGIYEIIMFDPMSLSVSSEKPYCGIISVKKVIELFPSSEIIPNSYSDNMFFHGTAYYESEHAAIKNIPDSEKEKLLNDWRENPGWMPFFPYVKGGEIHIIASNQTRIYHYIFDVNTYEQLSKTVIETDTELQTYNVGYYYTRMNDTAPYIYRWFYGAQVNEEYNSALSGFKWDDKYFVLTKYPYINGSEVTTSKNYGQLRVFTKDGKATDKIFQYVKDGTLSNMTSASFWSFYVDEKANTPLVVCDSYNTPYSMLALEIIKSGEDYDKYRLRLSIPIYGTNYLYHYANLIKTDGVSLPLYIVPFYPYNSSNGRYFGFALGIIKPCLTTINNLSSPVRKLEGQVMKITYELIDE